MPDQQTIVRREYGLENISEIASWAIQAGKDFSVWVLEGNLGAGKTTLVKVIGKQLGVEETMASPTFSIVNEYHDRQGKSIFHFDFYRLKSESEAYDIGVEEYFESENLCLVEWADKIPTLLPKKYFKLIIEEAGPQSRMIYFEKYAG
jgi:tRNA threonylcarbamoyladenosine biosynthesis protein TsaE